MWDDLACEEEAPQHLRVPFFFMWIDPKQGNPLSFWQGFVLGFFPIISSRTYWRWTAALLYNEPVKLRERYFHWALHFHFRLAWTRQLIFFPICPQEKERHLCGFTTLNLVNQVCMFFRRWYKMKAIYLKSSWVTLLSWYHAAYEVCHNQMGYFGNILHHNQTCV